MQQTKNISIIMLLFIPRKRIIERKQFKIESIDDKIS